MSGSGKNIIKLYFHADKANTNVYYSNVLQQIPGESACIHIVFLYVCNQRLVNSVLFSKAVERL